MPSASNFVWRYVTPLDGSKMNKPSYGYKVLSALFIWTVDQMLSILWTAAEQGWMAVLKTYPKPFYGHYLWFLWHTLYNPTHARSHSIYALNCSFAIWQTLTSPPLQILYCCPHLKLIKAYETGFLCDLHSNRKDGVIHCHFACPSLWQALF